MFKNLALAFLIGLFAMTFSYGQDTNESNDGGSNQPEIIDIDPPEYNNDGPTFDPTESNDDDGPDFTFEPSEDGDGGKINIEIDIPPVFNSKKEE